MNKKDLLSNINYWNETRGTNFDPLQKIITINNLYTLIEAQSQVISSGKFSAEQIEKAKMRLEMLTASVQFMYKIYDEGMTALNMSSHLLKICLELQAENNTLSNENEKLVKIIEAWN